jgi:TonB-linked SusC/RagA family outer membrane protein
MRLQHIFQKYKSLSLLCMCMLLIGMVRAQNDPEKVGAFVNVQLKIVDEVGNPIPYVRLVLGEGLQIVNGDEKGIISFKANPRDYITVVSPGYEKHVSLVTERIKNNTIVLKKGKLYATSEDETPLPFISLKKRYLTGNTDVLRTNQLEKYPSTDIRNSLTGLSAGVEVLEKYGGPGLSAEERLGRYGINEKISIRARGGRMRFVVDDIPMETEMPLDPGEIESITLIKDVVAKAMFGPIGADGIVYIKTKHGKQNERNINFNFENGVSFVDRFPQWVNGVEYARLNNQARINSSMVPLYTDTDIAAYGVNNPNDPYHPNINFRDMLLKNTMVFRRANFSSNGGNDAVQYAAYLGYEGEGDLFKIGAPSDYNRLNGRSNLDIKINDFVKVQFGLYGGMSFRRAPNYGYASNESSGAMSLYEFNQAIGDINTIPAISSPIYANNDASLKAPWYAVSSSYKTNPIANIISNGFYTETGRSGASNMTAELDLKRITSGLKARSYVGLNVLNLVRMGKAKDYIAYITTPSKTAAGADTLTLSKVHDGVDNTGLFNLHDFYTQRYAFYQNLSYQKTFGVHDVQSSVTYYQTKTLMDGIREPQRQQEVVWTGMYTYNNKYTVQGVVNYAGTYSFATDKRYGVFPSVGVSWIVSEEGFMPKSKAINYLKLRAQAGVIGSDNNQAPFYYRDNWSNGSSSGFGPYSLNQWFGSSTGSVYYTTPNRTGNPDLSWEKRKEISAGIDALLLNEKLSVEITYFNNLQDGQITALRNSVPLYVGISNVPPLFNYNQTRYFGVESGVQFTTQVGKLKYSIGGNATVQNSKVEKFDEPSYRNTYQRHTGTSADTYWGLTYLGKFQTDAETLKTPQLFDAQLLAGDLRYKDLNGDGFIDDNDVSAIGHTTPRLFYALNINLNYKNFEFSAIGTGRALYDLPLTNSYFWNGWGNGNYSKFVLDNLGAAYPRLTYNKVNNNFMASQFWLVKGGYFKIQNVELAYTFLPKSHLLGTKGIRLFLRGANLLTITKIKDVDPESLNSGVDSYPLFKTFTSGVKLNF